MVHWGLTAVALLLFLFAIRTVFQSSRDGEGKRQKLGCGFALVAVFVWIYVLESWLDDPWPAMRIGVGAFLLMPAVEAVAKPAGASILRAAVSLFLAVLIAGPPLQSLRAEYGPDSRSSEERELADLIDDLDEARDELVRRRDAIRERRDEVHAQVYAGGVTFDEVSADDARMESLQALVNLERALASAEADLAKIEARLPSLNEALAAAQRGDTSSGGARSDVDELDALLRALESAPPVNDLSLVEREARRMELEAHFEENR